MANKAKAVIWSLIVVILVLAIILIYAFAVQPAINTKQVTIYNAGYQNAQLDFVNGMLNQLRQQEYIQIPISENQTLLLVQAQAQQPAQ